MTSQSHSHHSLEGMDQWSRNASIDLIAKYIVEGFLIGLHKSPYQGASVEYAEHRIYNEGEPIRDIDWKIYAKTDRLYVKRYEDESNLRAYVLLDISSSMYYPKDASKLHFALYAASALGYLFHRQRDAVGLITFSDHMETFLRAKSSAWHLRMWMGRLEKLRAESAPSVRKTTAIQSVLKDVALRLPKRSMVVLFSDLLEGDRPENIVRALEYLRHRDHEVMVFHVRDEKTEVDFDFGRGQYIFEGLEGGKGIKINPEEVKKAYMREMKAYERTLFLGCGAMGIDFFSINSRERFDKVLMLCLRKRMHLF